MKQMPSGVLEEIKIMSAGKTSSSEIMTMSPTAIEEATSSANSPFLSILTFYPFVSLSELYRRKSSIPSLTIEIISTMTSGLIEVTGSSAEIVGMQFKIAIPRK